MDKSGASLDVEILATKGCGQEKFESIMSALQNRKFFICIQPKFTMPEQRIIGGEACLRWNEPGVGILFPAEFIPSAQSAGLMELLDLYAIEEVCRSLREWQDKAIPVVPLSVNLSASALLSPDFVDAVNGCMARHKLSRDLVEFEIPMAFMRDYPDEFSRVVSYFHEHGFLCSVDGFIPDLGILENVFGHEIDNLKIDCRAFISDDEEVSINNCIKTFREVAGKSTKVLIEGVENTRQLKALKDAGCIYFQGYALGMPVSSRLFRKLMERQKPSV